MFLDLLQTKRKSMIAVLVRDRNRQTDIHSQRQIDRDRNRDKDIDRVRNRHRDRQRDRDIDRSIAKQTQTHTRVCCTSVGWHSSHVLLHKHSSHLLLHKCWLAQLACVVAQMLVGTARMNCTSVVDWHSNARLACVLGRTARVCCCSDDAYVLVAQLACHDECYSVLLLSQNGKCSALESRHHIFPSCQLRFCLAIHSFVR